MRERPDLDVREEGRGASAGAGGEGDISAPLVACSLLRVAEGLASCVVGSSPFRASLCRERMRHSAQVSGVPVSGSAAEHTRHTLTQLPRPTLHTLCTHAVADAVR